VKDFLKNLWSDLLILLIFAAAFFGGYKYHALRNPCAVLSTDTLYIHDTIRTIPDTVPWYIIQKDSIKYRDKKWMDSVIAATRIDTNAILEDYYAIHYYSRDWIDQDSTIKVMAEDAVSENRIIDNVFSFQLLKPQTIINNVVNSPPVYNRYLTGGMDIPIKGMRGVEFEATYITSKYYIGGSVNPWEKYYGIKTGVTLWKFK